MAGDQDQQRYDELKRSIGKLGLIRHGSLVRRFMPCGTLGCRCHDDPPQLHGPYYQWTRKVHGKTVTVRLTEQQAQVLAEWIDNGRQLNEILGQMEAVALRITNRVLKKLPQRAARR
jgi:uncharacterized protein DUF6788